jgi:hypothetical protein
MHDADKVRHITDERSKAGSKGGKRSLETMTPAARHERAKKAAAVRAANIAAKKAAAAPKVKRAAKSPK